MKYVKVCFSKLIECYLAKKSIRTLRSLGFSKYITLWHVEVVVLEKTVNQKGVRAMEVAQQEVVKNYLYLIGCLT